MSSAVQVTLPAHLKLPRLTVPVNAGQDPVCVVKRAVEQATKIPPHLQRLEVNAALDHFTVPAEVQVHVRARPNQPSIPVKVETLNDKAPMTVNVVLDGDDTILDVKFLLAAHYKLQAENFKLFYIPTGSPSRVPLENRTLVKNTTIAPGSTLFILFIFPSNQAGHGYIVRSVPELITSESKTCANICDKFRQSVQKYGKQPYLGHRPYAKDGSGKVGAYVWQTYAQVGERVTYFGSGLRKLGLKKGESVGIMAPNRPEWTIADLACVCQDLISVPLYDTLGHDAVEYIINHASIRAVVVCASMLSQITPVRARCPTLQNIIVMDDNVSPADKKILDVKPPQFTYLFSQVEELGKKSPLPDTVPGPDDVFTICYTSGTTGNPKGAILSHANMIAAAHALNLRIPAHIETNNEVILSYLPLAHIYARVVENYALGQGHALGFFQGDTQKLVDDVAELRPTIFPGVPRVWQRIHDRIRTQVSESNIVRRYLFSKAFASKVESLRHGDMTPNMWDTLVFSKIADKFGGRIKLVSTGAAPLASKYAEFLRVSLNCRFGEGYGLTESSGALTTTHMHDFVYAHVGTPIACCEIKLVDVPDMDYLTTDKPFPRGEIWARGPNIFKGYYKEAEKTAEVFHDGWFMTGDVGMWQADGTLRIIDRKKNIFKLSQGEYIRPEYIEGIYKRNKFVAHSFVHGDSNQNYLVAIVVPNFELLGQWAEKNGFAEIAKKPAELAKNPRVTEFVLKQMSETGHKEKLRGFEHVKKIHLTAEDFSVDNGLLTPTFKLKRHFAQVKYQAVIDAMYASPENEPIKSKL